MPPVVSVAQRLAGALEPIAGQAEFSPECHRNYEALGFPAESRHGRADGAARQVRFLHGAWIGPRRRAGRGRRRRVRRVQPGRDRAAGPSRSGARRRGDGVGGPAGRRRRPAPPHHRTRTRTCELGQRTVAGRRRGTAAGRPGVLRRPARRRRSRTIRSPGCGARPIGCASSAATPTSRCGRRPGSIRWRSDCSATCSGDWRPAPTRRGGAGPWTSSAPARTVCGPGGCSTPRAASPSTVGRCAQDIEDRTDLALGPGAGRARRRHG